MLKSHLYYMETAWLHVAPDGPRTERVPLHLVPHHTLLHTVLCEQGIGRAEQKAQTQKHTAAYVVYFLCPFGAAQVKLGSKQRGSKIPEDPAQRRLGLTPMKNRSPTASHANPLQPSAGNGKPHITPNPPQERWGGQPEGRPDNPGGPSEEATQHAPRPPPT